MKRVLITAIVIAALFSTACGPDAAVSDAASDDQIGRWIGLDKTDAIALAESEGRPWRIAREDNETYGLDAALVDGRVTFEIDAGTVSAFVLETPEGPAPRPPSSDDSDQSEIISAAIIRLLTGGDIFGPGHRFATIEIAMAVGDDPARLMGPGVVDAVLAALDNGVDVTTIDHAATRTSELFETETTNIAVVAVDAVRTENERAEVDTWIWCGPMCGGAVTYEIVRNNDGWAVTGPIGPIAVA